jgi:hypothetical protein
MSEQNTTIAVWLLIFVLAAYGVGLRAFSHFPFLKLAPPTRIFAWAINGAARSRLRKREFVRDWFVYREGEKPGPSDLAWVQVQFIVSFAVIVCVALTEI